jgi:hypothetical protein
LRYDICFTVWRRKQGPSSFFNPNGSCIESRHCKSNWVYVFDIWPTALKQVTCDKCCLGIKRLALKKNCRKIS